MPPIESTKFKFEISSEAAKHNWSELQKHDNLGDALKAEGNSPLKYGSEFRPTRLLQYIFKYHPLWNRLKENLDNGVEYPLEEVPNDVRKKDLEEALEFGNHKGATEHKEFFEKLLKKDVEFGYSLVIPLLKALEIEGALMSPLNVQDQNTIDEDGNVIPSQRLTHNQSKTYKESGTSINSRVIKELLQDCLYGHMLLRLVHYIVALRLRYPKLRILMQKTDYKSAYRRAHLGWRTAIQTITKIDDELGQIALRATFGGAPNPNEWGLVSESICDLANAIMNDPKWDPNELFSPFQEMLPEDEFLPDDIPIAPGLPMIVNPPLAPHAKNDVYIDDDVTICTEVKENADRARAGTLLAMHVVGRPNEKVEPIKRLELPSLIKLKGEGRLEETKVILGWRIDTRRMIIQLPDHKFKAWDKSIVTLMENKKATSKELESLIGRLTHLSVVMQPVLHFLSRLRYLHEKSENRRFVTVPHLVLEDLKLHRKFLDKINKGISLNLMTYRKPTRVYRSDACPWAIGGYSSTGKAWRFIIPKHLLNRATLNMLESQASTIGPWIDIIDRDLPEYSCTLSMTDSSTTQGWARKSNFIVREENKEQTECKLESVRGHAERYMDHNMKDYTQWFPGDANDIADSLSRDIHLDDLTLTKLLFHCVPEQMPKNFRIQKLPSEIESWICAWLQKMPEGKPLQEIHKSSKIALGSVGKSFLDQLESQTTGSSKATNTVPKQDSSQSSLLLSDEGSTARAMIGPWWQTLSEVPWTLWHRSLGITNTMTQDWTPQGSLAAFYEDSTKATKTRIHQRNKKKQLQSACSKSSKETSQLQDAKQSEN